MQLKRKNRIIIGTVFLGVLVLFIVWSASRSSINLRLLDPRLDLIDVQFSRGRVHSIYFGGLQGRLRQKLHEFKIPVTRFGGLRADLGSNTFALSVCYGGDLSSTEAQSLEAVLVDTHGDITMMTARAESSSPTRKEYARVWTLDHVPAVGSVLQLRAGSNRPLAEITLPYIEGVEPIGRAEPPPSVPVKVTSHED